MNTADSSPEAVRRETLHDEIARRARELWEQEGCPDGCAERHWFEAERQLRGMPAQPPSAPRPAPEGNPAYPSLPEREQAVARNRGKPEPTRKIPASSLRGTRNPSVAAS